MELDDAYAITAHTPNAEAILSRIVEQSETFRAECDDRALLGLAYGDTPRQEFDLFLPPGEAKGTMIFIHGGYWRSQDRTNFSHLAAGALAHGWSVAMPSYDLCPDVTIAGITRQVARAVKVVADRTSGPISITGHSAGGHLAARMLDRRLVPGDVGARLTSVVPISPLSDLRPFLRTSMNDDFKMDEQAALDESPIMMANRYSTPVEIWVGADERPALLDQARWLSDAWNAGLVIVPEKHHFDIIDALADPESDLVGRLVT
ncbi:MAG: arylformamidase [Paracoccaceae bacterium]|jgi:arylformamidase